MSISEQDVRHVAALARVGVDDARLPSLVAELNVILAHMEVLQRVDIPVDATHDASQSVTRLRADDGQHVLLATPRESFAPAMRDGFFLVPRLATHGAAAGGSATGPAEESEA
jgi:aspartyl-tRNA(Asn)/glutamyl-tRNA(Gln) amidotransferase subunit C